MFKLFIGSVVVCLLAQGHFLLHSWVESLPFADSWAYYRNLHPVRHDILTVIRWGSLGASILTGTIIIAKTALR
ncbi:hypothetical protein DSM109990_00860 [Sulfitobacter dubius]|jgi:hypothetical protein|uniref:Uncharacterized protein n=1 Tax=Sulfitobacter dubius TaxID=218673 RepID=A0ABY3ZIU4_9RHOB|nr:hypothetical protein DSM109990_00860 [Sulfitobacter dubius]